MLLCLIALLMKAFRPLQMVLRPAVLFRVACESVASLLYVSAIAVIPFALVSSISQATPLVVMLGAAILFRAEVGWRRWSLSQRLA
ncbi:Hypothetical protein NGAL_HAMBI1145_55660 [Neorhizobium galegae bv. officinalis]|uniref:EamA domain-containing protein n=1 Tax=Neorhizobium galegae bv. officinalis TaxID=323656 RepID=A0A0T7G0P3_NEOGA|nr:Hypothetical protein NGAL_HAMBI1145_55660 [Neorhizobium galegae bv. officinalis]